MGSLSDKLKEAAGGETGPHIKDYDGQVITILGFEEVSAKFGPAVHVEILDPEGETVSPVFTTPTVGKQVKAIAEDLPAELKVVSFPSNFGKTGYKLEEPEG